MERSTMALLDFLKRLDPRRRRAEAAKAELKSNAEKALAMKRAAGEDRQIPPYATANEGMRPHADTTITRGAEVGAEAGHTPQLKRSKVARSGDTGRKR
jgi:hypothetical protein